MIEAESLTIRLESERNPRGNAAFVARCQGVMAVSGWWLPRTGGFRHLKRGVSGLSIETVL
ncbi:MAG: hypothetical protein QTN59_16745 [Candidatus Electrothrix communis]|nr:MAG: hypothetical protein QTN59_16745 [Candidatus Electrothrix communis]